MKAVELIDEAYESFLGMRPGADVLEVFLQGMRLCKTALLATGDVVYDPEIPPTEPEAGALISVANLFVDLPYLYMGDPEMVHGLKDDQVRNRDDSCSPLPHSISQVVACSENDVVFVTPHAPVGLGVASLSDAVKVFGENILYQFQQSVAEYGLQMAQRDGWRYVVNNIAAFTVPLVARVDRHQDAVWVQYSPHSAPIRRLMSEVDSTLPYATKRNYP